MSDLNDDLVELTIRLPRALVERVRSASLVLTLDEVVSAGVEGVLAISDSVRAAAQKRGVRLYPIADSTTLPAPQFYEEIK